MDVECEVVVAGAGPSGLMAAAVLASLGVRTVVIDPKAGPTRESRALAVHARSMEIFDQLGLIDDVLAEAVPAPAVSFAYRDRVLGTLRFTGMGERLTPYRGVFILEQSSSERILRDAAPARGVDVRWQHRLRGLRVTNGDTGVLVTIESPAGEATIRARWLIGADGASSTVREELGLSFEGTTNDLSFFVADARNVTGLTADTINVRIHDDSFMLGFPMEGMNQYRLISVADTPEELPEEEIEQLVQAQLNERFAVRYARSAWFSRYRVHHRVAEQFRDGPMFLVGDAAHVHSPVGAQGMNTGLQDAHNIACELAAVTHGAASGASLDRYEAERRPVANTLVKTTDAAFLRTTSRTRIANLVRSRVVPTLAPLALRRFTWQVHAYGNALSACEHVADAIGADAFGFGRDPFGRLSPRRLYLVRPDGFVASAATPNRAVDTFRRAILRQTGTPSHSGP